ncbi:MAG TPA: hypothetical protein DCZ92_10055 [Elusimicrobia bacterium]|nr:MAG: hypothetical protein A2016_07380 [Elusimicrobia bacterium GWF2_62_30]HBA61142.1 hypothetical protein [Elusimicrobiota bacterium]
MAGRKKFKVKVRVKVRNNLLRRGGAAAGIVLGLGFVVWISGYALRSSRDLISGRFFSFKPVSIEVNCPAPEAAASARELFSGTLNSPLTAGRCRELAAELKRRHPALSSAKVFRNFFTGKTEISAAVEPVVAPVLLNGATVYLGETGRLMRENLSGPQTAPFLTELRGAARVAGLVTFLKDIKAQYALFSSKPVKLECGPEPECSLLLEDRTRVLWGGFEFTGLKVLRLNEVLKDAAAKRGGPLRIDLRCFREGKIFVSEASQRS